MQYIFNDTLKTGHATIDGEHKLIIEFINDVMESMERGATKDEILGALNVFVRYVNTHFPSEEALQEKYHYPNIKFHRLWHKMYIKDINAISSRILTEGICAVTVDELKLRIEILVQHIMLEDSNIAKHIQKQNELSK